MKIASWNVNSLNVRLPHVIDWVRSEQPDILGLQETKLTDEKFPKGAIEAEGYHVVFAGQKTYNGVAILSKQAPSDVIFDVDDLDDPSRRISSATFGDLRFLNLYVVNGKAVGDEKYDHKLHWLDRVTAHIERELRTYPNMVVVGDFNIAPADADIYDPEAWHEKILCSTPERDALTKIMSLGFDDAFRLFEQEEGAFSWWDYRMAAFRRKMGLRIDLTLTSKALRERVVAAGIDVEPRRWERPSDHAPVWVELA